MSKHRKPRKDTISQRVAAANAPDRSLDTAPLVASAEFLDERGRDFLNAIYREDPGRWTEGDLALLVEAAHVQQQMYANRIVAAMVPAVVTLANGVITKNPIHVLQMDLCRQLQTLLRDLGIRSRDGHAPPAGVSRPTTTHAQGQTLPTDSEGNPDWSTLLMN
ncbi:hypothetical protein PH7735_00801 [Shimia thalassica]|uniref:Uncharacterized protein n=1 Tax=Shimia thalassica TaxID=1715693 RepID=A0A0P1I328_9RHOB|nr:hypothetical protein [Shimia thalassica]CUJ87678.1 hypothetical protein PH7735_00801 [Shimia thalassica]